MSSVIDYREYMGSDYKVYVTVCEIRYKDGVLKPVYLVWEDGVQYKIDKVIDVRPAASHKAGGAGMCYTIRVKGHVRKLYFEADRLGGKWFMERQHPKAG